MSAENWTDYGRLLIDNQGLDAGKVLASAVMAHMLHGDETPYAYAVTLTDKRTAWCRLYRAGWCCVAIAPAGSQWSDRAAVPRDEFFSAPWPSDWLTIKPLRKAQMRAMDAPPSVGGMMWRNTGNAQEIQTALIVSIEPLQVQLAPHGQTVQAGDDWRVISYKVDGWRAVWQRGTTTAANFRLYAMWAGRTLGRMNAPPKPPKQEGRSDKQKAHAKKWSAALKEGRAAWWAALTPDQQAAHTAKWKQAIKDGKAKARLASQNRD